MTNANVPCSDDNIEKLVALLRKRSNIGLSKYGVTTEREDLDFVDWIKHLQEEMMDAVVYIQAALRRLEREQDDLK